MRRILAIIIAKITIALAKLLGHGGSNFGGELALRICPDILAWFGSQIKDKTIFVTGTNGKTSTNNMIYSIIRESGHSCVCNRLGANLDSGLISAFIGHCDLIGRVDADYAALEVDEASLFKVMKHIKPHMIVFTNIFRDQLDRYSEIDALLNKINAAIRTSQRTVLLINSDDPALVALAEELPNEKYYYGIENPVDMGSQDLARDSVFCKECGKRLHYKHYYYGQLGHFACDNCGFKRPAPHYKAHVKDDGTKRLLTVADGDDSFSVQIDFHITDTYSLYNTLAAVSCAALLGNSSETVLNGLEKYKPQIGRMERFDIGKPIVLNLAKNPVGFNESMKIISLDTSSKVIALGINDMPSDGIDVSWLWDTNFEILLEIDESIANYTVFGRRRYDMALRLKYAGIDENKITVSATIEDAVYNLVRTESNTGYVLVNYSLLFETQKILKGLNRDVKTDAVPSVS
ncbi:MAG: MurT ligase domain-containing protein [Tepidanaerobacteraceae bacterium]